MRIVYINKNLTRSNGVFWKPAFKRQSTAFIHIAKPIWTIQEIVKFKPDHIHWNSSAQPVPQWLPIDKIKMLRQKLPKTIFTHYYCDALKAKSYRDELIKIMDATFMSYVYPKTIWMPVPSSIEFWNIEDNPNYKWDLIFVGNVYAIHLKRYKLQYTRQITLKEIIKNTDLRLLVVGDKWAKYYRIPHKPRTVNYNQTREYYRQSFAGLNISNESLRNLSKCWSARLTHMMLAGLPCFTPNMPYLDQVLEHKKHCLIYENNEHLLQLIDYYFKRRNLLKEIGKQGQIRMRELADIDLAVMKILETKRKK